MNDQFALLVDPVVQYVLETQRRIAGQGAGHPGIDEVHDQLLNLLKQSRLSAASYERPRDYIELAEYALVYWADEVLINSSWVHADAWRGHRLLEWELYGEAVAGDAFFARAEKAAHSGSRDALETFFLCVALGFQGRCARDGVPRPRWSAGGPTDPELLRWGRDTFRAVREDLRGFLPRDDGAEDVPGPLPGRTLLLRVSILSAVTVLATLAAWILTEHLAG
jgi:type VI secretion system protein ImpK